MRRAQRVQRCNYIVHAQDQTGQHASMLSLKMRGGVFSGSQSLRISELGPDRMRSRTSMHTSRTSGHDLEDFRERRSVVCMIDRVCFVMYRCNYELLISPYNLFHPTINTLQPGRLLMHRSLWRAVAAPGVAAASLQYSTRRLLAWYWAHVWPCGVHSGGVGHTYGHSTHAGGPGRVFATQPVRP